jgi:hypothetical protein
MRGVFLPPPIPTTSAGIWKSRVAKKRTPDTGLTSIRVAKLGNAYTSQPVSTLIVRPMTSLGTVGGSSWTTARTS